MIVSPKRNKFDLLNKSKDLFVVCKTYASLIDVKFLHNRPFSPISFIVNELYVDAVAGK
jgi:hypothetical protein